MPITRTLDSMATNALRLADLENATNRFPTGVGSEVYGLVNKAIKRVYGEMILVEDKPHFVTEPAPYQAMSFPPPGQPFLWALPVDYMQLVGLYHSSSLTGPWSQVEAATEAEYVGLLNASVYGGGAGCWPRKYLFMGGPNGFTQGTLAEAYSVAILPSPSVGSYLKIRYVPSPIDLVNPTDTAPSILGFEDAAETWAAILMRRKDDLDTGALERDFAAHLERIRVIAKRRDRSAPPTIQLTRNRRVGLRGGYGRRWG